jgi:hypothetical protein
VQRTESNFRHDAVLERHLPEIEVVKSVSGNEERQRQQHGEKSALEANLCPLRARCQLSVCHVVRLHKERARLDETSDSHRHKVTFSNDFLKSAHLRTRKQYTIRISIGQGKKKDKKAN